MKTSTKLLFVLIGIIAICLAGCLNFVNYPNKGGTDVYSLTDDDLENLDDKEEKCWHIFVTYTVNGQREDDEFFLWGTEYGVALQCMTYIEEHEAEIAAKGDVGAVRAEYKETDITREADCKADTPTPSGGSKKCWVFYMIYQGEKIVDKYVWCTKAEAESYIEQLHETYGYDFYYDQVAASDKASCEALNEGEPPTPGDDTRYCYYVHATVLGYTMYDFTDWWTTETLKDFIAHIEQSGYKVTYEKTSASSKDACYEYDYENAVRDTDLDTKEPICWYYRFQRVKRINSEMRDDAYEDYTLLSEQYMIDELRDLHKQIVWANHYSNGSGSYDSYSEFKLIKNAGGCDE
jgi:hypothetical protein